MPLDIHHISPSLLPTDSFQTFSTPRAKCNNCMMFLSFCSFISFTTMSWWSLLSKYIYWLFSHCIHHIDVYDLLRHFPKDHFQGVFSEHSFLWLFIIQVLEFMRLYKEFYYNIKQSWRSHLKNKSLQASFLLNTFPHREWLSVTWHHLLQHREKDGAQGTNQGILFIGHWLLWGYQWPIKGQAGIDRDRSLSLWLSLLNMSNRLTWTVCATIWRRGGENSVLL